MLPLLLTACGDGRDLEPRDEQPATPVATRFAWPANVECEIEEQLERGGRTMTLRYRARLEPLPDGGGFVFRRFALDLAAVNEQPVDPTSEEARHALAVLSVGMPPLLIDPHGRCRGMHDAETFATELRERVAEMPSLAEDAMLKRAIEMSTHPSMRSATDAVVAEPWLAWVESWLDCTLSAGEVEHLETRASVGFGGVEVPARRKFEGYVRAPADHARIAMRAEFDADAAIGAAGSAVLGLIGGRDLRGAEFRMLRRAVVDPSSLRPLYSEWEMWTVLGGEPQRASRERHVYSFRWLSGTDG